MTFPEYGMGTTQQLNVSSAVQIVFLKFECLHSTKRKLLIKPGQVTLLALPMWMLMRVFQPASVLHLRRWVYRIVHVTTSRLQWGQRDYLTPRACHHWLQGSNASLLVIIRV